MAGATYETKNSSHRPSTVNQSNRSTSPPEPAKASEVPTVAVVGAGIVGTYLIAQLNRERSLDLVVVTTRSDVVAAEVRNSQRFSQNVTYVGRDSTPACDVAVLACPSRDQPGWARRFLASGSNVVAVCDDLRSTKTLLGLGDQARSAGLRLVVGAGFSPGLTVLISAWLSTQLGQVNELHIAKHGTGGPACAHQHQRALRSIASEYRDARLEKNPAGTGRELVWFPGPIYGADCYRAEVPDPILLHAAFPEVRRITARVAANRRDRFTSWLPPLLPPPTEGGIGAIRVEARGVGRDDTMQTVVAGASGRPGAVAAAVAAEATRAVLGGQIPFGATSLANLDDPGGALSRLRSRNVTAQLFVGSRTLSTP